MRSSLLSSYSMLLSLYSWVVLILRPLNDQMTYYAGLNYNFNITVYFIYRLTESTKSYAEVATTPARNRQHHHYSQSQQQQQQQQQQQPQRMSPFDELMAQHQRQLAREQQLLRLASTESGQRTIRSGGRAAAGSNLTAAASGQEEATKLTIPPPPATMTSTSISSKFEDIPLAEPPFEYSTPARSELVMTLSISVIDWQINLLLYFSSLKNLWVKLQLMSNEAFWVAFWRRWGQKKRLRLLQKQASPVNRGC